MTELIETLTNEHLYPPLLEVPNDNLDLADGIEFFEDDIADVSAFVLEFFAKYEEGGLGGDFAADFRCMAAAVGQLGFDGAAGSPGAFGDSKRSLVEIDYDRAR